MFKNFLKVTLRSLLKSKLFVFINIIGLGMALACCIVAYLNYDFATSFDEQHENYDELYEISMRREYQGSTIPYGMVPMAAAASLKEDLPSIKAYTRFERAGVTIKKNTNIFNRQLAFVDDDFLEMFTFPVIHGDKNAFKELSQVLISERTAISLFGKSNAVGETVEIVNSEGDNVFLNVGGVFEDVGLKSSLQFQLLAHFENFYRTFQVEKGDWSRFIDGIFIQTDNPEVAYNAPEILKKYVAAQNDVRKDFLLHSFWIQTMDEVPFNQRDLNGTNLGGETLHPAHILAPNIMAILILLLACFNFTNTAIAMSNKRLKEIGIRKTVGGSRAQMMFQFFGENLLLCFLALVAGLLFANWLVPKYSDMWPNMTVSMTLLENPALVIFLLLVLLGTALLAGGYPALFVSKFRPVAILRGTLRLGSSSILSKILLGFQFMISILALISGYAFIQNAAFQEGIDQGYDKEGLFIVPMNDASEVQRFRAEIEQNPLITTTAATRSHIGWGMGSAPFKSEGQENELSVMDIGMGYFEAAGMRVISGRSFNEANREIDRQSNVLVNEKTAERFGWQDPVGKELILYDTIRYQIVGMFKNVMTYGVEAPIQPTMVRLRNDDEANMLLVKTSENQVSATNEFLEATWAKLITDRPENVLDHNQNVLGGTREVNKNIVAIFMFLSVIAVILSIVGLFTLVTINILSRMKEIGVRKVLGASIPKIATLINRPFLIIVGVGAVLGSAAAYMLTGVLMGSIWTYHMSVNAITILIPVFLILFMSFLTISGKVLRAAKRNPVDSLRYE